MLTLSRADGIYIIKGNSITSLAFFKNLQGVISDLTVYTKASICRISTDGTTTGIDGNVTLRMDAHDGSAAGSNDTVGFTVLSTKNSALYYSNNWSYDSATKSWKTMQQEVGPATSAIIIK